jgi:hypothetical protein
MKKLFLLTITAGLALSSFAQVAKRPFSGAYTTKTFTAPAIENALYKTTTVGAVDTLSHITAADTIAVYDAGNAGSDSGYVSGMDEYEDRGYAERYDFNGTDSTLQVIGLIYEFTGTINPSSTKNVNFKVWSVGAQALIDGTVSPNVFYSGLPNTVLTSDNVSYLHIGVGTPAGNPDTAKIHIFTTPTAYLSTSFFVGFELTYTWAGAAGDTIGLLTTLDGERTSAIYNVSGTDTVVNDVNVSEYSDNTWHDNAVENFGIQNNFVLFPLVKVGHGLSVAGVTNKNLTFYGNYPNPAITSTNVKFSLLNSSDVTIEVMDMNGRTINTINQKGLSAGEHIINLSTTNMPSGDYVYVIHASKGGGIASKFTVVK